MRPDHHRLAAKLLAVISQGKSEARSWRPSAHALPTGSTPFSRTLTRRPIKAMRSVHVKAQEVHCRVQAWRG
ncbi:hypothetical protein B7L66_24550 (plasmid) [Xanthomonas citri pv. citri]|nr:hypothetical protein B7L66_24550 [Xanthomonas citri pv. citri]ARR20082.1 hypothetical protein B7L65_24910 [Xanthomonas citri pv. citri]ARR24635.1 hypothetical protein B7L67_24330 [Xanthomonas citri pv. citri]